MQELGRALANLRDELAWTSAELERSQIAEHQMRVERDAVRQQLDEIRSSATWRTGRLIVGPVARMRRKLRG